MDELTFDNEEDFYIDTGLEISTAEFLEIYTQAVLLSESFKFNTGTISKEQLKTLNDCWFKLNQVRKELNRRNTLMELMNSV